MRVESTLPKYGALKFELNSERYSVSDYTSNKMNSDGGTCVKKKIVS